MDLRKALAAFGGYQKEISSPIDMTRPKGFAPRTFAFGDKLL